MKFSRKNLSPATEERFRPLVDKNEAEVVAAVERRFNRLSMHMRNKLLRAWLEGTKVVVGTDEPIACALQFQEALARIKQLEVALGRKTLENDFFRTLSLQPT